MPTERISQPRGVKGRRLSVIASAAKKLTRLEKSSRKQNRQFQ